MTILKFAGLLDPHSNPEVDALVTELRVWKPTDDSKLKR